MKLRISVLALSLTLPVFAMAEGSAFNGVYQLESNKLKDTCPKVMVISRAYDNKGYGLYSSEANENMTVIAMGDSSEKVPADSGGFRPVYPKTDFGDFKYLYNATAYWNEGKCKSQATAKQAGLTLE